MKLAKLLSYIALVGTISSLMGRSIILEFKGAYFLPTDCAFKSIFHHGSALFGPELTVQLCDATNWYAFTSVDYFQKKGRSVGLCDKAEVQLVPLAVGVKYFVPSYHECADFYLGLGFEAVNVRTHNCSQFVIQALSQWAVGGIAKVGVYWYLPHDFVIDLFVDYSFAKTSNFGCRCPASSVQTVQANVSGAIFGIGIGYNF